MYKNPLEVALYFVDEDYRNSHINVLKGIKERDIDNALQLADRNKISYSFCKNLVRLNPDLVNKKITRKIDYEERRLDKLKCTLEKIISVLNKEGIDFLLIKTFKNVSFVTDDVDIYVREEDYKKLVKIFKRNEIKIRELSLFLKTINKLHLGEDNFQVTGGLNIDVYDNIPWTELPTADEEFLWKNPRNVDVSGMECKIPSYEADLLILIATTLYTDGRIPLIDFLYINSLTNENLNLEAIRKQTEKYGWGESFFELCDSLKNMQKTLYEHESVPQNLKFPYYIPKLKVNKAIIGPLRYQLQRNPSSLFVAIGNVCFRTFFGRFYYYFWQKKNIKD